MNKKETSVRKRKLKLAQYKFMVKSNFLKLKRLLFLSMTFSGIVASTGRAGTFYTDAWEDLDKIVKGIEKAKGHTEQGIFRETGMPNGSRHKIVWDRYGFKKHLYIFIKNNIEPYTNCDFEAIRDGLVRYLVNTQTCDPVYTRTYSSWGCLDSWSYTLLPFDQQEKDDIWKAIKDTVWKKLLFYRDYHAATGLHGAHPRERVYAPYIVSFHRMLQKLNTMDIKERCVFTKSTFPSCLKGFSKLLDALENKKRAFEDFFPKMRETIEREEIDIIRNAKIKIAHACSKYSAKRIVPNHCLHYFEQTYLPKKNWTFGYANYSNPSWGRELVTISKEDFEKYKKEEIDYGWGNFPFLQFGISKQEIEAFKDAFYGSLGYHVNMVLCSKLKKIKEVIQKEIKEIE